MKKLSDEQVKESVTLYQSGHSLGTLGMRYGVSRQSMYDLLKRRIPLRSHIRWGSDNHFYRGTHADDHAQNLLEEAIERGRVVRKESCEECGATGTMKDGRTIIQAHHSDYNKPLDVKWLCQKCHHKWHSKNIPIARAE